VITLLAGDDAIARRLASFQEILASQLDGGLSRFGAARSEINASAIAKIAGRNGQHASRQFLGWLGVKLGGMRKGEATGLLGHSPPDLRYAVTNAYDRGLP
jgi:hypothetical protein